MKHKAKQRGARVVKRKHRTSWKLSRSDQHRVHLPYGAPGFSADPLPGMKRAASYPSFRALFAKNSAGVDRCEVLVELDLDQPRALSDALIALDEAVARSSSLSDEFAAMLSEESWRPQLVAAAALALGGAARLDDAPRVFAALWGAVDRGSPVGPHLAAAASLCDLAFEEEAKRRIESRCPVVPEAGSSLAEKLSQAPGERAALRSPLMLSSLLALTRRRTGTLDWLVLHLADPEVGEMIGKDPVGGGYVSTSWCDRLLEAPASTAR